MRDNILAVLDRADEDQLAEGLAWYTAAHEIAGECPDGVVTGAGVLAALSPVCDWDRNVDAARACWSGLPRPDWLLTRSWTNARTILAGTDPYQFFRVDVPEPAWKRARGAKTRNFFLNIAAPSDPEPVTVDRHAVAIARNALEHELHSAELARAGAYEEFADAYRDAATATGLLPCQVQAVTWLVWRDLHYRRRTLATA